MSMITLEPIEVQLNASNTISTVAKRWLSVLVTIYSFRIIMSHFTLFKTNENRANQVSPRPRPSFNLPLNSHHSINIDSNPTDPTSLANLVRDKDLKNLNNFGGVKGVAEFLNSCFDHGIDGKDADNIKHRKQEYGSNTHNKAPSKGFFDFIVEAFKDDISLTIFILILFACAALSIGFGIKEHVCYYSGVSFFVAMLVVISLSPVSKFVLNRQFGKLSLVNIDRQIDAMRSGRHQHISIFDIVVGDIIYLKIGDRVPADGLFIEIEGHSLKVDESIFTGETNDVEINTGSHPFLSSGTIVSEGYAMMLVTAVGMSTKWGQMMSSISLDPSQEKLNKLTSFIGKVGWILDFFVAVVMLVRYFTGKTKNKNGVRDFNGSKTKFHNIINTVVRIVADAVTSVAIPGGHPLALSLTLSCSMEKMMADKACETMGFASVRTQGARNAVEACQHAGVNVQIITGDNCFHCRWERSVYINIQKFVQFQLTMNTAALVINFVAAMSAEEVPHTAVQSLWVNLIMDTLGALALATEKPTKELMEEPPIDRAKSLITNVMLRNLLAQAFYQIAISMTLQFGGKSIFGVTSGVIDTLIFNTFVLCQVFNQFNAREMEEKNVFKGIRRSKLFLVIIGIIIFLQVMMVEFLNKFADTEKLNLEQWAICIGLAAISLPIGFVVKFIPVPDKPLVNF